MNFAEFCIWRSQALIDQPNLLDCSETNVYRALAYLRPAPVATQSTLPVYRCDLARAWLRRYGFPDAWSRRALVCRGVRHALSLLLNARKSPACTWWMPRDSYPVYLELAHAAQIEPYTYSTWPTPAIPIDRVSNGREAILLPNPLKPLGRFVTDAECDTLNDWLAASKDRCVVLDCAYDLTTPLHPSTRRLWDSGQVIVLHTITKNWLSPKTFGIALVPASWQSELETAFRTDPPSQEQLSWANECLFVHDSLPQQVAADLNRRRAMLLDTLPPGIRDCLSLPLSDFAPGCYHFPVTLCPNILLTDYRVLSIPATAFGGVSHVSILTSLSDYFRNAP